MSTPLVTIGCPVRNRAWILPEYLAALEAIDHPRKQYLFLENDSTDDTGPILWDWMWNRPCEIEAIHTDGAPGHERGAYNRDEYAHMAYLRNQFLRMFLESGADYLLSVDSDVIVPPDILQVLLPLADERTIVGAALSNIVDMPLDGFTCGNFMVERNGVMEHPTGTLHPSGDPAKKTPGHPLSGVMEVALTGACVLIPRAVVAAGARYAPHHQGEDLEFCRAARAAGARVVVSFDVRPEHRMKETTKC